MNRPPRNLTQFGQLRLARLQIPPGADLPADPETTRLIASIVELELSSGLSTRGESSYLSVSSDPTHLILAALIRADRAAREELAGLLAARIVLDELQIDNIVVASNLRGNGLGTYLLADAIKLARQLGCTTALLEVRSANLSALSLYYKLGFCEVGRRPGYYHTPPDDAITMSMQL